MKRSLLLLLPFFLLSFSIKAQTNYQWGNSIDGDVGAEKVLAMVADPATGDVYVGGSFSNKTKFSTIGLERSTVGGVDAFVAKYDKTGALVWLKEIGTAGADAVQSLALDGMGNVIAGGYVSESVFGETHVSGWDALLVSIPMNGSAYNWTKLDGTSGIDEIKGLTVDPSGNIYTVGTRRNGTAPAVWLAKYNSGNGSKIQEMTTTGGGASSKKGNAIAVDRSTGNIYITGQFQGNNVDFNPLGISDKRSSSSTLDGFTAKYDADFKLLWMHRFWGSRNQEDEGTALMFSLDGSTVYVAGSVRGRAVFESNGIAPGQLGEKGPQDGFLIKYNVDGNLLAWSGGDYSILFGGQAAYLYLKAGVSDLSGNLYLTGWFNNAVDFGGGLRTPNKYDAFALKLGPEGSYQLDKHLVGPGNSDIGNTIAVDTERMWIGGEFGTGIADKQILEPDPTCSSKVLESYRIGGFVAMYGSGSTSAQTDIISFIIPNGITELIDPLTHTIRVKMPDGTDLSSLAPTSIGLEAASNGTVSPGVGVPKNFTNSVAVPIIYTVTDNNCSGGSQDWKVTVTSKPTPFVDFTPAPNCNGTISVVDETTISDPSLTLTYEWNFGDGTSVVTGKTPSPHLYANPGAYTITLKVKASNGTNATIHKSANLSGYPKTAVINLPESTPINTYCQGPIDFNSTGSTAFGPLSSYLWSVVDAAGTPVALTGNNQATFTFTPPVKTTPEVYTVKLKLGVGGACPPIDAMSKSFTINPSPKALFTMTANCDGTVSFTNNSTAGGTYVWDFGDGTISNLQNPPAHPYTTVGLKTVKLKVTANGCSDETAPQSIQFNGGGLAAIIKQVTPGSYCQGGSMQFEDISTIKVGAIQSRVWKLIDVSSNEVVVEKEGLVGANKIIDFEPPVVDGVKQYKVSLLIRLSATCTDHAEMGPFTVYPNPKPIITETDNCKGTFNFSTPDLPGATYEWNFEGLKKQGRLVTNTYTSVGQKTVILKVRANDCETTVDKTITVYGANLVAKVKNISLSPYCQSDAVNFEDESTIDFGTITKRSWKFMNAAGQVIKTEETGSNKRVSFQVPVKSDARQIFTVILTAAFDGGCEDPSDPLEFYIDPNPTVKFKKSYQPVCIATAPFELTGGLPPSGIEGNGYYSVNGELKSTFSPQSAGIGKHTIRYTYKDATTGCESFAEQVQEVTGLPQLVCKDYSVFEGVDLELKVNQEGPTAGDKFTYEWFPATGLSNPNIANPILSPTENTVYRITVKSAANGEGCESTCTITVKVLPNIQVPNIISPNGDGINDTFYVEGIENYPLMHVQVFDRYGTSIYNSYSYSQAWDGKIGGKDLPQGTYYYVITPRQKNLSPLAGSLTIVY